MADFAVDMRHITKKFPLVLANDDVNFNVLQGQIHALVGENGAGKSTLVNILYGLLQPDRGAVFINGQDKNYPIPVMLSGWESAWCISI